MRFSFVWTGGPPGAPRPGPGCLQHIEDGIGELAARLADVGDKIEELAAHLADVETGVARVGKKLDEMVVMVLNVRREQLRCLAAAGDRSDAEVYFKTPQGQKLHAFSNCESVKADVTKISVAPEMESFLGQSGAFCSKCVPLSR